MVKVGLSRYKNCMARNTWSGKQKQIWAQCHDPGPMIYYAVSTQKCPLCHRTWYGRRMMTYIHEVCLFKYDLLEQDPINGTLAYPFVTAGRYDRTVHMYRLKRDLKCWD